jgi:hypothetical protein
MAKTADKTNILCSRDKRDTIKLPPQSSLEGPKDTWIGLSRTLPYITTKALFAKFKLDN